ncbi:MAG: N-acetylmuramoyl-L-alanine amidase [Ruminococcus sp.]|nr:N-acetylmuramoyl-L-alanine amidase [Ruminococcus sp.]
MSLTARGKAAEGCNLFISLHSNVCNSSSVDASLVCCTVSGEVNDLGQELADTVASVMGTSQGGTIWNRVGTYGGDWYTVLNSAAFIGVPGILLEHSYHTNLAATNWLLVDSNLEKMAYAEAAVIAAYFGLA